ncbi:MAG: FAD-dependent oxidoreductase [Acidimicrobiales bacterium]|jgi:phytoene dehydrogenase-like protein|nr:FAD-dependent oxidoreductase [Acidimicrobiales bacterium]
MPDPDAIVIGAGPNGLVAANVLADAGWDVVVLEANDEPGGAVRTAEVTAPGYRNDLFSAFYPLAVMSPAMRGLDLERYGLRWVHAPNVLAHPVAGEPAAVLSRDIDTTAASLERFSPGDGDGWRAMAAQFEQIGPAFVDTLLGPFPPVRAGANLGLRLGPRRGLEFGRLALIPVRRLAEETFRGAGGGLLLAGNSLHADISPDGAGSGVLGWLMTGAGQRHGFPVPEGGAASLTEALVARLESRGGSVVTGARVVAVDVRGRRAVGVRTAGGEDIAARRAVLADVDAVTLYRQLVAESHVPADVLRGLDRFHRGPGTVKVDWALDGLAPWTDDTVRGAGTVHIADSLDELSVTFAQLAGGQVPDKPFVIIGQMTTTDPTRSPPGTESAWAYAHVPATIRGDAGPDGITGKWDERESDAFVGRMEDRIEVHAPGFRDRVIARHVFTPPALEQADANLVAGDINGGTSQLHQSLVFRPLPGRGRPETPVKGLYLASASAHPGGGVHGACGFNAARAAIAHDRLRRIIGR